jgi:phosphatidylserine/phosphatidylglycerophosphate/cardiolipin synthase-like enzyme
MISVENIAPLANKAYYYYLLDGIREARHRLWASVFFVNVDELADRDLKVRRLLKEVALAHDRGVDVRILLGGERERLNGFRVSNELSRTYLQHLGVEVRVYDGAKINTHAKFVLIDDDVTLLGSHNWSPRSFARGIDDSVALRSDELNTRLARVFLDDWMAT